MARLFYQAAEQVYTFQVECASANETWQQCAGVFPGFQAYANVEAAFETDIYDVSDTSVQQLANAVVGMIGATHATQGEGAMPTVIRTWFDLNARCGQIIQEQQ